VPYSIPWQANLGTPNVIRIGNNLTSGG